MSKHLNVGIAGRLSRAEVEAYLAAIFKVVQASRADFEVNTYNNLVI